MSIHHAVPARILSDRNVLNIFKNTVPCNTRTPSLSKNLILSRYHSPSVVSTDTQVKFIKTRVGKTILIFLVNRTPIYLYLTLTIQSIIYLLRIPRRICRTDPMEKVATYMVTNIKLQKRCNICTNTNCRRTNPRLYHAKNWA